MHGHGVRRDAATALRWLRRASRLGDVTAGYELGCAYYRGTGVERNSRLAMKWLRAAAQLGHEEAQAFLERIERGGELN